MRFLLLLFFLAGCGYRFDTGPDKTLSIYYTPGEQEGLLADALIWEFSQIPGIRYLPSGGELCLDVKVVAVNDDKIGYRYDRRDVSGKLRKNLVAVENRKILKALVTLKDRSGNCLLGPLPIEGHAEYDYADQNSLRDLSLVDAGFESVSSVGFSLGQLDTIDGAKQDAFAPAYRNLAEKIAAGILAYYGTTQTN